jgi:hypothetical protein
VAELRGLCDGDKSDRDCSDQFDCDNEDMAESDQLDPPRNDILLILTR